MKAIRSLYGNRPHPSYRGWRGFLKTCEIRDEKDGCKFYGITNCNYILFPNNIVVCNYGYHGKSLMNWIRDKGWKCVFQILKKEREKLDALLRPSKKKGIRS